MDGLAVFSVDIISPPGAPSSREICARGVYAVSPQRPTLSVYCLCDYAGRSPDASSICHPHDGDDTTLAVALVVRTIGIGPLHRSIHFTALLF